MSLSVFLEIYGLQYPRNVGLLFSHCITLILGHGERRQSTLPYSTWIQEPDSIKSYNCSTKCVSTFLDYCLVRHFAPAFQSHTLNFDKAAFSRTIQSQNFFFFRVFEF